MPTYTLAPREICDLVSSAMLKYHPVLSGAGVTVNTICACATIDEASGEPKGPAIMHHGYPALAVIKINSVKDRVEGKADATLTLDYDRWPDLSSGQQLALLDHELEHLLLVEHNGEVVTDDAGRPKLRCRPHDWELGGFNCVVDRHGAEAIEAQQYIDLNRVMSQKTFPWG